jgi:hypothetical protein
MCGGYPDQFSQSLVRLLDFGILTVLVCEATSCLSLISGVQMNRGTFLSIGCGEADSPGKERKHGYVCVMGSPRADKRGVDILLVHSYSAQASLLVIAFASHQQRGRGVCRAKQDGGDNGSAHRLRDRGLGLFDFGEFSKTFHRVGWAQRRRFTPPVCISC